MKKPAMRCLSLLLCIFLGLAPLSARGLADTAPDGPNLLRSPDREDPAEAANAPVSSDVTLGTLLSDLLDAALNPPKAGTARIDADLEALNDSVASAVADCWKRVYLDPNLRLLILGRDDPAELAITGKHAFVVLGYALENGEMTDELQGRCDAAAAAAAAFPRSVLVLSGGATGEGNVENHTEAGLMKQYLAGRHGIDPERICTDERAMTTAENAQNTMEILETLGVDTMTLVTSAYHQPRAQVLYTAVAALYAREKGYSVRIVGSFCFDAPPPEYPAEYDAVIAAAQLAEILSLPEEEMQLLLSRFFPAE